MLTVLYCAVSLYLFHGEKYYKIVFIVIIVIAIISAVAIIIFISY